ncbi:MAG TPA: TonB family protein [Vicinamibacteria bacterium]|nr:TonB family protein [Vicinamibacteria bacterium]
MNEAVDRLIAERERLDAGLPGTVVVSIVAHLTLIATVVAVPMLLPKEPLLKVADGFAVVLPRGGGSPVTAPPAPPAAAPRPAPPVTAPPAPAPKIIKPPTKEVAHPNALPTLDSRRLARRPEPAAAASTAATATAKATGTATPGLSFGPPGPGVPNGTDSGGDWYLAGVQQKIWMLWNQQIKAGFTQPIGVTFTIMPDGSVTNVRVTQPSGATLLDMAAQRAVVNAAPFGPLPREYGQNPRTIQALFRPTS